jgi:hydrogenase maturation protease
MKKIGVIGIGNPLRCDDGIGIVLLKKLVEQKKTLPKEIEFIDGGTGGVNLLHLLPQFDIVIIIDAMQLNVSPGSYFFFKADDIKTNKNTISISTHTHQLAQVIEMSRQLGELPKQLFIFGIQPKNLSYKTNLSNELQTKINTLLNSLQNEITTVIEKSK